MGAGVAVAVAAGSCVGVSAGTAGGLAVGSAVRVSTEAVVEVGVGSELSPQALVKAAKAKTISAARQRTRGGDTVIL